MKTINTILMSAACLTLGACSFSIEDGGHQYRGGSDYFSVTLPSGERTSIHCPEGTNSFVLNNVEQGKGLIYGCRTLDAPLPSVED